MTKAFKQDLRTIIEVLLYIVVYMSVSTFLSNYAWLCDAVIVLSIGYFIYSQYNKRFNKNIIVFPTLNDTYSRMMPTSFGIMVIAFSVIGYFAFNINIQKVILIAAIGIAIIAFGYFQLPEGWLSIDENVLKICGVKEKIDTHELKEITLKNHKITLTNIYHEGKFCNNLKLDPLSSEKIKKFLEEKLPKQDILIIDEVIDIP